MRRAVVVTFLGVVACGSKGEQPISANPPPPPPTPAPAVEPAPPPGPVVLNGRDAEDGVVLRAADGSCYVNFLKPLAAGQPVPTFQVPEQKKVDCPAHMTDPSWDVCAGGVVKTVPEPAEGADCVCTVVGNPPPPPRPVACPKRAGS